MAGRAAMRRVAVHLRSAGRENHEGRDHRADFRLPGVHVLDPAADIRVETDGGRMHGPVERRGQLEREGHRGGGDPAGHDRLPVLLQKGR